MSDLSALLAWATTAKPPGPAGRERNKWAKLWPVYAALRKQGFPCEAAVAALVEKGAVPETDAERALNSFHCITTRRNKKQNA